MITWSATIASKCRYGDIIGAIFAESEVIWEHSENDYQGFAAVLVSMPDGTFIHYTWSYGSCSGCDEWEARELSEDQIRTEVIKSMAVLPDSVAMKKYLKLDEEYKEAKYPSANSPTNGPIPATMHQLTGGISDDFKQMGVAFLKWLESRADRGQM